MTRHYTIAASGYDTNRREWSWSLDQYSLQQLEVPSSHIKRVTERIDALAHSRSCLVLTALFAKMPVMESESAAASSVGY